MADAPEDQPLDGIGDEPQGIVAQACHAGLEIAEQVVAEAGFLTLAGFSMMLIVPLGELENDEAHAKAGLWLHVDAEHGPSEPAEVLNFLLGGAKAFAEASGIPFATFDMPPQKGQG